jgi:hypothetical protein
MNEQKLVDDAYADVIKELFKNFADEWTRAKAGNNPGDVQQAEQNFSKGLQLRKDALAKALSLIPGSTSFTAAATRGARRNR